MANDIRANINENSDQTYVRLQAGDVLTRCLEDASVAPIHQLVESLVLAGPESLDVLREILAEASLRKVQVEDDLQQVLIGLKSSLEGYGVRLRGLKKPLALTRIKPVRFLHQLRSQGVVEEDVQTTCLQLFHDARDLVMSLETHYYLLNEIENYLEDWTWGIFYQSVHQGQRSHRTEASRWVI